MLNRIIFLPGPKGMTMTLTPIKYTEVHVSRKRCFPSSKPQQEWCYNSRGNRASHSSQLENKFTCRPTNMQSPTTKKTLRARCLDDILLLCRSYAFDTALLTGNLEWQTLHSIAPFILSTFNACQVQSLHLNCTEIAKLWTTARYIETAMPDIWNSFFFFFFLHL